MQSPKYKRILLKLSGEAFKGEREYGIDPKFLTYLANEIKNIHELNVQIGIVIGGGNIFRGLAASANGMDRVTADYTGMLATIMNAIALQDALKKIKLDVRVQSAIEIKQVAESFILQKSIKHLENNRIVIFSGGTGNPYFTTDTTAALRAAEIKAEAIFKATKVNGVYDKDPMEFPDAKKFTQLNHIDVLQKKLKVMDSTALSLSMDNNIPIVVFDLMKENSIKKALLGEKIGTQIGGN
ncbi:UMP kinase [bacterium]|nr:UMP kinase [Actinomycetota bacterium]MBE33109.1 UMP kinase [bacterium]|tara:strand:- start:5793 stop:6512 length:720 start_codon:yes stop_codon:yes gene_type:complete